VNTLSVSNRWVNIIAELSSTGNALYINGTQQSNVICTSGSRGTPGSLAGTTVYIGGMPISFAGFSGSLADVQVYNTPLTTAQVSQLYLNNSVAGLRPAGWWPLSSGYNGYTNQTGALAGTAAYEYGNGNPCSEAQSLGLGSVCGVTYLPFGVR
jgi:hypothetical protein